MSRLLVYTLVGWTVIGAVLLIAYMVLIEWVWQGVYYIVFPLTVGPLFWRYRETLAVRLENWRAPAIVKFALLTYTMVLGEEILAATVNHLAEGYDPTLHFVRILQFQLLNLFAFSGMAWGGGFLFTRYRFSRIEMFVLIGIYGQISEHLFIRLFDPSQALAAFTLIPLNFWVYVVIFVPAILSIHLENRRDLPRWARWAVTVPVIYVASIPFIFMLIQFRANYPDAFPPTSMIP